jgi:Bacterial PH domain
MVTRQTIKEQLEKIDFSMHGWNRSEIEELKNIILPDEEISECVNGFYEGGFALLVATDIRVILVDKKPLNFLSVEDLRFDMINEIDYNHRAFGAGITITTGSKALKFTSYNKQRLRKLIGHVQHCMANTKKTQADSQAGQHQHLEQINQQLQAYLVAQYKQQQKLQDYLGELQTGNTTPPVPVEKAEMSRQLKDYLFANGLLEKYAEESGNDPVALIQEQAASQASSTPVPQQASSSQDLDDLYADGMREVFGKSSSHKLSGKLAAVQDASMSKLSGSFDFSPLKAVYRILPSAIGKRRFGSIGAKSWPAGAE